MGVRFVSPTAKAMGHPPKIDFSDGELSKVNIGVLEQVVNASLRGAALLRRSVGRAEQVLECIKVASVILFNQELCKIPVV